MDRLWPYENRRCGVAHRPSQVAVSLVAFILVYGLLGGAGYYLIAKYARLGPDA